MPDTDRGYRLGFTFIIDGIGFDFWPISWQRLERIANWEEPIISIIRDGRILYHSSEEALARYHTLRERSLAVRDRRELVGKASASLDRVYRIFWQLFRSEDLADIRREAIAILQNLASTLALLKWPVGETGAWENESGTPGHGFAPGRLCCPV